MPELPEVEIAARRIGAALEGAEVESAASPGMVALKTFDPPLSALDGMTVEGTGRVGKMPIVHFTGGDEPLDLLVHLMSAGRLQVFDKRASMKDRASRVLIRLADGRELRLREFGTKQRAWVEAAARGRGRRGRDGRHARARGMACALRSTSSPPPSTSPATSTRCCATSARSPASAAAGSTRSSGRRSSRPSRRARSSTRTRSGGSATPCTCWATRSTTTRTWSATRSRTRCRCRSRSTSARASHARAAGRRSRPSSSPSTRRTTARRSRPGGKVLKDRRLSRLLK